MSQQTGSNAIRLVQPGSGQTVNVPIDADNMRLFLGFVPDPNAVVKNGQNLEFSFEDGGKIVLEGYYDHFASKTLPVMVTEGGDELPGEDFLASLNEDLLTAAGPSAGSSAGSGGAGEYADDPGALVDGIDRLGSLGTIYWNNETEIPEDYSGVEYPSGSGSWNVTTTPPDPNNPGGLGIMFAGVFEDGKPWQNLNATQAADQSIANTQEVVPGVINFTFDGDGATECRSVTFTGFHEGTQIFYDGSWHTISGVTEAVQITYSQLAAGSVLILPPFNNDDDMTITTQMEIGIPGYSSITVAGPTGAIVVDAVADLPNNFDADVAITEYQDGSSAAAGTTSASKEVSEVAVKVDAVYGDVLDGSESHFVTVSGIPSDWTLENFPAGWQLVDADGNAIDFADVARGTNATYELLFQVVDYNSVNDVTETGTVSGTVTFDPHDWTSSGATDAAGATTTDGRYNDGTLNSDGPAEITVTATAVDKNKDGELDLDNNVAVTEADTTQISITEDVVTITSTTVTVTANEAPASGDEAIAALGATVAADVTATLTALGISGTPLAANSSTIAFNTKSDGASESTDNSNASGVSVAWDADTLPGVGDIVAIEATTSPTGAAEYHDLTWEVDAGDSTVIIGYYLDSSNNKVVAMIGKLTLNAASDTAEVTFVQVMPVQHADGNSTNTFSDQFGYKVTDNDGDVAFGSVTYTVTDDIPTATDDTGYTFSEDDPTLYSNGVFTLTSDQSVLANDDPGADGFMGGLYTIDVQVDGTSVGTFTFTDTSADFYTVTINNPSYPGAPAAGTLTVNRDGTWSFKSDQTSTGNQDVLEDFDITVEYTYKDADGDIANAGAGASLEIGVEAGTILVSLTGDTSVRESTIVSGTETAPQEEQGVAVYTVALTNGAGSVLAGTSVVESVTVSMKIDLMAGMDTTERADFDFIKDGNQAYIEYTYMLNGVEQTGKAYITVTGNPAESVTFDVTLPKGAEGSIDIKLPITDDSVGGAGGTEDSASEQYSLEITNVTTNLAGVEVDTDNDTVTTEIIDDGYENGAYVGNELTDYVDGILDGTNTHLLDGPVINITTNKTSVTEDNDPVTITVNLSQFDGTATLGSAWTNGGNNLAEPVTISLNLDDSNTDNGAVFQMTANLKALITAGKVTLELDDGTVIDSSNISSFNAGTSLGDGDISLTLTTKFNPSTDAGSLTLQAASNPDYVVDDPSWQQSITVTVTGSSGQESLYKGDAVVTDVTDNNGTYLHLTGGGTVAEGNNATYNLKLCTSSNGTGTVTSSQIQGDLDITLSFTATDKDWVSGGNVADGAVAGSDYLSAVNAALADPSVANLAALAVQLGLTNVEITSIASDSNGGFSITIHVDAADWASNGSLAITVPTIKDADAGEPNEVFTVKVTHYSENEGDQEVAGLTSAAQNGVSTTITDPRIEMSVDSSQTSIWEEAANGATIGEFVVSFTQASNHGGTVANGAFEFNLTLKGGSASFYDGDPADAPITGSADYHWVVKDGSGNATTYDLTDAQGKIDFIADLQAQLDDLYGVGNVTVSLNGSTSSLHFVVAEGTTLHDLPVYVQSIDDQHSDSGETINVVIDGLTYDPDDVQVAIVDRDASTNILDGGNTGTGSGQWLGLVQTEVVESTANVTVGVQLYNQGDYSGTLYAGVTPPTESMTLTFGYSNITATGNQDYVTSSNKASIAATDWEAYNASGDVVIKYEGGNWVQDLDGNGIFETVTDWNDLQADANAGNVSYWQATPTIPNLINDDRLDEGDEEFNIWIESVSGNESAPLSDGMNNASGSTVTIKDDESSTVTAPGAADLKDGPTLEAFVLNGRLREVDNASKIDGSGDGAADPHTTGVYTIAFDAVAAEDIIVELKLEATGAELGKDFTLEGVMTGQELIDHYTTEGWPKYMSEADVSLDKFYVIVPEGSSSVNYTVNILHDHDTQNDGTGVDSVAEGLAWTITDMVGSEVQWDNSTANGGYGSADVSVNSAIEDDMMGPTITIDQGSFNSADDIYATGTLTGTLQIVDNVAIGEGEVVTVTLWIVGADGTVYPVAATGTWNNGEMSFTADISTVVAEQRYFYVRVGDSEGGETRVDPDMSKPFIPSGGNPILVTIEGSDIWESTTGKPESTDYTLTFTNLNAGNVGDVSLTIKAMDNTAEVGDDLDAGTESVTVSLDESLLQELLAAGNDSFEVQVISDADGNPTQIIVTSDNGPDKTLSVDASGNIENGYGTVTGKLPVATDDTIIEGDEQFTPIVVDPSGNLLPNPDEAPKEVTIHDNDQPTIQIEFGYVDSAGVLHDVTEVTEGEMTHSTGNEYVVRVSLVDSDGNSLVMDDGITPTESVTIILTVKGTGVNTDGAEDVTLFTQEVTLYPGDSLADVRVIFPEDFITDPNKTFTIEAEFKDPTDAANFGNTGLTSEGFVAEGSLANGIEIIDHINGPVASLLPLGGFAGARTNDATEASSANYVIKLDTALEEAAAVPMKFSFDDVADTADGMTPADIKSISIGGVEYTVTTNGDSTLTLTNGGSTISGTYETGASGNVTSWTVLVPMSEGSSGVNVSVNFHDDSVSEADTEYLKVELINPNGAYGGELTVSDTDNSLTTNVAEVKSGPDVSLNTSGSYASAMEGEEAFIGLTLTKAGVEDFTVNMTVLDTSVLDTMTATLHYYKDGSWHETTAVTVNSDGTFTVTVPAGATDAKVEFDLKDNVKTGANNPLEVSLDGVQYGEAGILGGASYGSSFVEETYNTVIMHLGDSSSEAMTTQTQLTVTLGKIDASDVTSIKIGTTEYKSSLKTLDDGTVVVVIDCPAGTVVNYDVTVTFANNDDAVANKQALGISASETGQTATVTITDDVNTTYQDGPVFTVEVGATNTCEEGQTLAFTISPNPQTGFETSEETITLKFTVTGDNVDSVTVAGHAAVKSGTTYTVTLPAGTDLTQDLDVSVVTKADSKVDTSSTVTVTLSSVTGGEATLSSATADKKATGTVTESSTTAASLVVTQSTTDVTEGTNLSFMLALKNSVTNANMTASEAMTVSFLVTGTGGMELGTDLTLSDTNGKWAWTDNEDGTYTLTVTLPANTNSLSVSVPVVSDGLDEAGEGVTFEIIGSSTGTLANVTGPISGTELEFAISDPAANPHIVNLTGDENFDGGTYGYTNLTINGGDGDNDIIGSSGADTIYGGDGVDTINGGAGNDVIYGGAGNDTLNGGLGNDMIYGGAGNDILTGGAGNDTFVWQRDDLNSDGSKATDIITDFSMNASGDNVTQDNITADGGYGNDILDLSALVDISGSAYTLEDFVSITKDEAGNAVLDVKTAYDGDVVQTIILENVYNTHAIENNDDAVTQMIKDHIIINSGG
ncbi:MAG: hypothetical protein DELT_01099 [Desulfovibrio sp.]